ncbi:amiloride-sensitive sodium channel [Desmophyllum pertusum]|uniref:Amiloride-sensitive sodium channel n=1 Tax=Desmophyllum pertusum TaxID=174260 RepID=A0A9W9Z2X9_9CNID|nr:amiloride-sensitive sodium channel [Desmophyllum pertusum]
MDVTPGYNTNIRIHRSKTLYLEPPFKPPCGTRKLVTTETYSTSTCFMECFKKHLMDVCNCRFLGLPVGEQFNVTNYCTTKELRECFLPTTAKLNPSVCDCPVQCEKIKYDLQLSSAYFPSPHFWDTVYQLLNESDKTDNLTKSDTQEIIRKRLLKVNIFYDSLSTEVTLEKPAYDLSDFASDLGGSMGLFMGCSILTLCEFLDLLIMALVSYYSSRKRGSQKITDHESVANHNSV